MEKRIEFLDYVRVAACFMVIVVHSCEFYFIDGSDIGIRNLTDGFWVSVFDSAFRCSVPLFVMISGYLLVPLREDAASFLRKRFRRVVVPFVLWSVLYATLPWLWQGMSGSEVGASLMRLATNFNDASGHLWFVYMLLGLYLFMPVLSPWLAQAGRRAEQAFLVLWFAASFFPYLRERVGGVFGECYWNEFNALWYFSGFIGYVVLAHYVRHHLRLSRRCAIVAGACLYAAGYLVTAVVWYGRIPTAASLQQLELSWRFCTPNVIAMSLGAFILIRALAGDRNVPRAVRGISVRSYGIYLMHIFVLGFVHRLFAGLLPTGVTIPLVGIVTFAVCCAIAKGLSYLPFSRYVIG